jgi:hypothetical protein
MQTGIIDTIGIPRTSGQTDSYRTVESGNTFLRKDRAVPRTMVDIEPVAAGGVLPIAKKPQPI